MGITSISSAIKEQAKLEAQDLLNFIDASPSPWHAVNTVAQRLLKQGFTELQEKDAWQLIPGGRYFIIRGGASIIAFHLGNDELAKSGFHMVGAHTDSPGLRLKPNPAFLGDGLIRIGVEVYGGPILATFTDRDLSIAGRVHVQTSRNVETHLFKFDQATVRLPNLAIHMNREVNEQGLKLNKQTELPLIFGEGQSGLAADKQFLKSMAQVLNVQVNDISTFELNVFDTQKGVFWGMDSEFIANSQLDNLASCHAALSALTATKTPAATCLVAFFDHEEVGSESASGAGGSFLPDVIARISNHAHQTKEEELRTLAHSFFISADMAHAYHPNFPQAYEPSHHVFVNKGPVIKTNANQRYSTNADTSARFITLCNKASVPYQQYAHRTDLGCGSTIGPIIASRLGVSCIDVGSPMWAMHSIRESAGVLDHHYMVKVLEAFFKD